MSELTTTTTFVLHKEESYAYIQVKDIKVLLIHESPECDIQETLKRLIAKVTQPFLIIQDKNKEYSVDDLTKLETLVDKVMKYKMQPKPPIQEMIIKNHTEHLGKVVLNEKEFYQPSNPHRSSKSRNCKIRRR